ncbi:MAG: hypothetical protein IKN43_06975 [Selenomonadaceae bacterium]|nr:hypothetical protein [Selenomonadaceae bacterium]
MPITVEFSPNDVEIIQKIADMKKLSISAYIHNLTIKAIREAEELAIIDNRLEQVKNDKVVYKTIAELEAMESE